MTVLVAIDPGVTGALAFYATEHPAHVAVYDMPAIDSEVNAAALRDLIKQWQPDLAYVERVGPMPRDGVKQAWRFSAAYATARVITLMLNIPTILIPSNTWKKGMKVRGKKNGGGEQCRALAIQLFPASASSFSRKKDAGRAEAALLAYYATRLIPNNEPKEEINGTQVEDHLS